MAERTRFERLLEHPGERPNADRETQRRLLAAATPPLARTIVHDV